MHLHPTAGSEDARQTAFVCSSCPPYPVSVSHSLQLGNLLQPQTPKLKSNTMCGPLQRTYQKPCLSHTRHPSVQDVEVGVQGSAWTAIGDPVSKRRRKSRRKKRRSRNTEGDPGKPPSYLDPKRGWCAVQWASSKCLKSLRNRKLSELWWMSCLRSKVHEGCKKLDVAWYH